MFKTQLNSVVRNPLFIVLIYASFGLIWIKYSDQFLENITLTVDALTQFQTYKGNFFIFITSVLLFLLVKNNIKLTIKHESDKMTFIMSTPFPLVVVQKSGKISFVNRSFSETYGYEKSDIPTITAWWKRAYTNEEDRNYANTRWSNLIKFGVENHNTEEILSVYSKDKKLHKIRFFTISQENSFIILCIDKTKEDELNAQLRQTEKMSALGQLAGGIAHDFNNQLAVINGYVEMLKLETCIKIENLEAVDSIQQSIKHAANLTSQILLFSRDEKPELKKIDLNEVLNDVIKIVNHTFPKSVVLSSNLSNSPLYFNGNSNLLMNAILNLAINARDAMENHGEIKFKTFETNKFHVVEITDNGSGIPDDILPKIFDPFFTTKKRGEGTGMGLAGVYSTLEEHNGVITVETEEEVGTTFIIKIPKID
jgi:signal transduction histidine kinase